MTKFCFSQGYICRCAAPLCKVYSGFCATILLLKSVCFLTVIQKTKWNILETQKIYHSNRITKIISGDAVRL